MASSISALYVYPVKSCRGIELASSPLVERGLARDREWMIVDGEGRFVTQREIPRLALVEPSLTAETLELGYPGAQRLAVPLRMEGVARAVIVWRDSFLAIDQGDDAAAWLSSVMTSLAGLSPRMRAAKTSSAVASAQMIRCSPR